MVETRQSLGVTFPPMETRREVLVRAAVRSEELGYDAFFVGEAWGLDAAALIAEIATKTERILLGTAILSVWSRSAATLAMAATTLSQISGGRFVLGLGASTPQLTEGFHDVTFSSPLKQVRRVVTQVHELLQGDRIPLSEGNDSRALRLGGEPAPVPVYLAALAPASVRLTGEIADGWMPFFFPLSRLHEGLALLQEGSAKGSAPGHPCRICPAVGVAVAEDERVARESAAWWVAFYLTTMGPLYAGTLKRFGYGSEVAAVLAANPPRSTPVVPPEAESLIDELIVCGTPSRARERLARWYAEGAELPIISFPPNRPWEETEFALVGLAPARNGDQEQRGRIGG
jgi:alkanesulfonate monooxygenase SsuD/methylene tetrahydromethanopterin reductase-like flavin-dependent oxidoreductase (luciferase family)